MVAAKAMTPRFPLWLDPLYRLGELLWRRRFTLALVTMAVWRMMR